jgi:DNA-binding CsgD family transcriptional regulator
LQTELKEVTLNTGTIHKQLTGMKIRKPHIRLTLVLLTLSLSIQAQISHLVTHYSRKDYGAGNQNWSIDIDKQGFIYAGNNNGLLVFDGVKWKIYQVPGHLIIRSVLVADDGRIYTGSFEEFGYWEKTGESGLTYHSLKPLLNNYRFHNEEIWKIVQSGDKIYFQSFSSLFVYDKKAVRPVPTHGNVVFLLKAGEKMFLQNVRGALFEIINNQLRKVEMGDLMAGTEVKTILPYGRNNYLIGTTSSGLFMYDGKTIKPWEIPANELLKQSQINNGIIRDSLIIFGTIVRGIVILNHNGMLLDNLKGDNALQDNTVLSLSCDKKGNLWAGLDRGIDYIAFDSPLDLYLQEGGQSGAVYTAALDGNDLYVGTNRGVSLYRKEGERYTYAGLIPNSQGQVWELKKIDGQIFCGHTDGTFIIRDEQLVKISDVNGGFSLQKFTYQGTEYLIQSTYSSLVLYRKEGNAWKYYKEIYGFVEPSWFLEADHLGNFWIGHSVKGLYKVQLNPTLDSVSDFRSLSIKDGLDSDNNTGIFKIDSRVVFTTGRLIYTWDDLEQKIIPYSSLNEQLMEYAGAKRIVPAGNNKYWFLKQDDVALFEIRSGKAKLIYRLLPAEYHVRMVENFVNIIPLNDSESLLCLDNGFVIIRMNKIPAATLIKFKPVFRSILAWKASGEKLEVVPGNKPVKIPHSNNSLSITFTPENNPLERYLYQFKLENMDTAWSAWSDENEINYSRLPKGDYVFHVRALLPSGLPSEEATFLFTIKPPWYASALAFSIYGIILLGIILISQSWYRRKVNRQHERQKQQAIAKTLLEKKQAEQEIITLQNQNLETQISYKNLQLADATYSILKKNELLIGIKEELEKQRLALGNRYPNRYFERINSLINKSIASDKDWQNFEVLFEQAHENFFKRLKTTYPDLTPSDLKLCAYLKLNLSSKEIAPLLNISIRGVEIRRYRLRKRLALASDDNLVEFIMQF